MEPDFENRLQAALAHHHQGDLESAITAYQALRIEAPEHVAVLANLGSALKAAQRPDQALECFRQALNVDDTLPQLWFNYANLQRDQGDIEMAEQAYRRALDLDATLYPACFNLANLLRNAERNEEAEALYREALRLKPDFARVHMNLGNLLRTSGRFDEATASHRSAVQLEPNNADAHYNLGNSLRDADNYELAAASYTAALQCNPDHQKALLALGLALYRLGRTDVALTSWKHLIKQHPEHVEAHLHLAAAYRELRQIEAAVQHYREAHRLAPKQPEIDVALALTLLDSGHIGGALALLEPIVELHPEFSEALKSLGNAHVLAADVAAGLACYERALKCSSQDHSVASNLLFASLYLDWPEPSAISIRHRTISAAIAEHVGQSFTPIRRGAAKPLRVGYLSADLRNHPVGFFIEPLLAHHDPAKVKVSTYYVGANTDETTLRLKQLVPHWHDCNNWSDDRLGTQIVTDEVDILIDLGGHTAANRARLIARKPAPVQALYLGYPCTSGMAAIDYLISDTLVSPQRYQSLYSETVITLDGCFLCFRPPADAPPVAPPPLIANTHITFGSFNHLPKISARTRALWAQVLDAVPNSRLILKALSLADAGVREQLWSVFAELGIARERIDLLEPSTPLSAHLGDYARLDIALDPVPYTASTTTCQALWMGVPVITLAGQHFHQRMGASVLTSAHLPDLVANSEDEYVAIAVALAANRERLTTLRNGLREQLLAAPLCDETGFAAQMEDAYQRMCCC
ncbi:MAG: tetratricopeptide repeat protein [Methylococcales bacterium]